ncbi:MAG: SGNH/GDSL hydrolase family protein [Prevotellaceae bacterium]|nr:SGNH/GDSL hydrolase family protein [Prevotellaceae bacterium]
MKHLAISFVLISFLAVSISSCSDSEEVADIESYIKSLNSANSDLEAYASKYPEAGYKELAEAADTIYDWAGKSIAVLGGSLAANDGGDVCKSLYCKLLHCSPIVTYARGGFGFATKGYSVLDFLPYLGQHDIYILWCSTNDYNTGIPVGEPTDYTEADGFNEKNAETQCGGMNKCIRSIREAYPGALVVGFTSLPFFGEEASREDGYSAAAKPCKGQDVNFSEYIEKQKETFERADVPYFDQFAYGLFDIENYTTFYVTDGFHLNRDGYFLLGCKQVAFFFDLIRKDPKGLYYYSRGF